MNNPEVMMEIQTALEAKMETHPGREAEAALQGERRRDLPPPQRADRRQPERRRHRRRVLRLQLRLLQAGLRRHRQDGREGPQGEGGLQGAADPLQGLRGRRQGGARGASCRASTGRCIARSSPLRGEINEQTALKAVEKLGLDMAKLKKDMEATRGQGRDRDGAQPRTEDGHPGHAAFPRWRPGHCRRTSEPARGHDRPCGRCAQERLLGLLSNRLPRAAVLSRTARKLIHGRQVVWICGP